MAKKENQSPKCTLNDKEYDVNEDFNDEQKKMYLHLKNIDDKINSNLFMQEQLGVNRNAFSNLLIESIAESEDPSPQDPGDKNN